MLNDLLGWIVVLGSLGLYLSRFFLPEVQRKNDAIWSGIGLFYGLILWANGDRIKGGLLLGQMASVALIVWLGWQASRIRPIFLAFCENGFGSFSLNDQRWPRL
jgi:Ycf66 protein N-terminus